MNLQRRLGKLETTFAPPAPPSPVRLTAEQRHDVNEILARVWNGRNGSHVN